MNSVFPENTRTFYINSGITPEIIELAEETEKELSQKYLAIDDICEYNQMRVLDAYRQVGLSETHFAGTSGYGYDDAGREKIQEAFSMVFGAQKALVRHQISSGTQAISAVLFGVLRPGDEMLSVTGRPYDTLAYTIGISKNKVSGSLKDFGISYSQIDNNAFSDENEIEKGLKKNTKLVFIQKSKGYSGRKEILWEDIEKIVRTVKRIKNDVIVFVDNCYGEFSQTKEPCHAGADICAGSLIKNPGGGICLTGGYIAGKPELVEMAASALSAPGVGSKTGPTLGMNRMIAQGLFFAPHTVSQAMKGNLFAAGLLGKCGFEVFPGPYEKRGDIVQGIIFPDKDKLIDFCREIQYCSPVDSFLTLQPSDMPGYENKIIMAAGNFVQGASSELSCDAPIRFPYIAYLQGGLVYNQVKYACMKAACKMCEK